MTHVDNLRAEDGVWKFTLVDGRKMRTGTLGIGIYEYNNKAKKYKLIEGHEKTLLSVNRLAARVKIRKLFDTPLQKVRSIPEDQLDFGLSGHKKGRKSFSWYTQQLTKLNNKKKVKA